MASEHDADAVVARIWQGDRGPAWLDIEFVLSQLKPGDRLPGGLVVVPEEPTEAMLEAAGGTRSYDRKQYRAMLRAASGDT